MTHDYNTGHDEPPVLMPSPPDDWRWLLIVDDDTGAPHSLVLRHKEHGRWSLDGPQPDYTQPLPGYDDETIAGVADQLLIRKKERDAAAAFVRSGNRTGVTA